MQVAVNAPSPDDNPIDWAMIQSLYLQGLGPTAIAKKTGVKSNTISVMATRKGWAKSLQRAGEARKRLEIDHDGNPKEVKELENQSQRARKALGDVIARSAEKLASVDIKSVKHALTVNQEAESLVRNSKTVFGWSEGQSQPAVRIGVLSQTTIVNEAQSKDEAKPVIDVESNVNDNAT